MVDDRRKGGFKERGPTRNIRKIISEIEEKLNGSIKPETLNGLNSFERKLVHRHFDHNSSFETRTYRDGENFKLSVYPVANIKKFATERADESLQTGNEIALPPMGSYERYIVHSALQDMTGVETESHGEGSDRHVKIVSKRFGRGLKKIAKKIKLI
jgi:predicted RNA-binding protein Jag